METKKYKIIYADPAWQYSFSRTRKYKNDDYFVMKTEDICKLPIKELSDDNCVLFIWVIYNKLEDALKVIKAWGFEYVTCAFCWVKTNKQAGSWFWGMGGWTRANSEICLLAKKGKPKPISNSVHNIVVSKVREHSQKPDEVRSRIINLCGDLPRIELFARERIEGWDVWGNQTPDTTQMLLPLDVNTKEDGIPPTNEIVGILPKRL